VSECVSRREMTANSTRSWNRNPKPGLTEVLVPERQRSVKMVSDVGGKSAAGQADNYSEGGNGMGWEEPPIQSDPRRRCTCVRACGTVRGRNQEPPNRKWSLGFLGIVDCGFALLCFALRRLGFET
jgi:hypothetical protein